MSKNIAIIGFDTLSSLAIKTILYDVIGYKCCIYNSEESNILQLEHCSAYIITQVVFLSNLDFFLPRKNKIILVSSEKKVSNKFPVTHISIFDKIERIEGTIKAVLQSDTIKNNEQKLSSREIDVLKGIAQGKINKEIADSLNISVNTVITHRKNISAKLGIRTVSGLSLYAVMNGIV